MQAKIRAVKSGAGGEVDVVALDSGIGVSADVRMLWTAKGYGWQAMSTAAVACLIVRPDTVAIASLYNNTSDNFVIDRVFAHNLVSIANGQFGIWLCVHPVGAIAVDAPTNDITVRNSTRGLPAGSAQGYWDVAATVVDDGWFPWGENSQSVTATVPGSLAQALVEGRIILPPTAALSMSCVGQTAVVTVCMGAHWYKVPASELAME